MPYTEMGLPEYSKKQDLINTSKSMAYKCGSSENCCFKANCLIVYYVSNNLMKVATNDSGYLPNVCAWVLGKVKIFIVYAFVPSGE